MELVLNIVVLIREATTSMMERYGSILSSVASAPMEIQEKQSQTLVPDSTSCFDSTFRYTPRNTVRDVPSVSFPRPFRSQHTRA